MTIGSLEAGSARGSEIGGGGDGTRIGGSGVLIGFRRWMELVIFPLVIVVQRDEEIFMARFKWDRRLPCWYKALVERNCLWHTLHRY